MPKENDSIIWSGDIGERLRELQKQEGRAGAETVSVTDRWSPIAGAVGDPEFPHFRPLRDVPTGFVGIVLIKYSDGRWGTSLGERCSHCAIPLAQGCCFAGCSHVWWAPQS